MKIITGKKQREAALRIIALRKICDDILLRMKIETDDDAKHYIEDMEYLTDNFLELTHIVCGIKGLNTMLKYDEKERLLNGLEIEL